MKKILNFSLLAIVVSSICVLESYNLQLNYANTRLHFFDELDKRTKK